LYLSQEREAMVAKSSVKESDQMDRKLLASLPEFAQRYSLKSQNALRTVWS
jgi:hypothetical protein